MFIALAVHCTMCVFTQLLQLFIAQLFIALAIHPIAQTVLQRQEAPMHQLQALQGWSSRTVQGSVAADRLGVSHQSVQG